MSPIKRIQEYPRPQFTDAKGAEDWAKKLITALQNDATMRVSDIDQAITTTSHNHNASAINAGTLVHERGGLEADVNAYDGLLKISGGATSQITDSSTNWDTAYSHTSLTAETNNTHAIDSWTGSTSLTTLGTIATGTWNGSDIDNQYITSDVRCRVYLGTNQNNIANTTFTKIQLDTEDYDTGSDFDNSSNYYFTAPVTGWYDIKASIVWTGITAEKLYGGRVAKNGSTLLFYLNFISFLL